MYRYFPVRSERKELHPKARCGYSVSAYDARSAVPDSPAFRFRVAYKSCSLHGGRNVDSGNVQESRSDVYEPHARLNSHSSFPHSRELDRWRYVYGFVAEENTVSCL